MSKTRLFLLSGAFCLLPFLFVLGFYVAHEAEANKVGARNNLSGLERNSYKHTSASRRIAATLLYVGLQKETTESVIGDLGFANEWLEKYTKRRRDSTAEMMRDLANNHAGFVLATHETTTKLAKKDLTLALVVRGVLINDYASLGLSPKTLELALNGYDLATAQNLFDEIKSAYEQRIELALSTLEHAGI